MDWQKIAKASIAADAVGYSMAKASAYEQARAPLMMEAAIRHATLELAKLADAMGFDLVPREQPAPEPAPALDETVIGFR